MKMVLVFKNIHPKLFILYTPVENIRYDLYLEMMAFKKPFNHYAINQYGDTIDIPAFYLFNERMNEYCLNLDSHIILFCDSGDINPIIENIKDKLDYRRKLWIA